MKTFPRFLDLPAELRVRIYEYHLEEMMLQTDSIVHQPPICLASRQLRAETLSIFYAESCVKINTELRYVSIYCEIFHLLKVQNALNDRIKDDHFKLIPRVHIELKSHLDCDRTFHWIVCPRSSSQSLVSWVVEHEWHGRRTDCSDMVKAIGMQLEEVVKSMQARSQPCVLLRADIDNLCSAVRDGLWSDLIQWEMEVLPGVD